MDYLYDQIQHFSISVPSNSNISQIGFAGAIKCAILTKQDYEDHKPLYLKIAQAIQYGALEEHSVLLLDEASSSFFLRDHLNETTQLIICFGLDAQQLGLAMHIQKNRIYSTETYTILFTDSLGEMKTDTEKKKAFWTTMQAYLKS